MVDYRKFRSSKINTPEFSHLKYLLYWPIYGLMFLGVEQLLISENYHVIHSTLDDAIPFCEYFLIPYLFWFVFLIGMSIYTLLWDTKSFVKFMQFIIISYTAAIVIYVIFPNCQQLRPAEFARDNIFTRFTGWLYQFDTSTNVCPSIHVIGSAAVMLCAWKSKHFSGTGWRITFAAAAVLISISTVFLKQHSVIDVAAAIPVCALTYVIVYRKKNGQNTIDI